MLVLARRSLLALACASAAIAIPAPSTYPDGALTRDLVIRQNAIENCKDSYTTKNGLAFTNYCGQNNPQNDAVRNDQGIGIWFYTGTYTECLEHCSRFWGDGEGCFGITWTGAGGHCWLRTSNVTTATLDPQADAVSSVLTDRSQMKGYDTECPNADLSDKALTGVDGISYTTHCGKVIAEPPHCFNEFDCLDVPYRAFYHTESLEECLRVCAGLHPLCRAVSWNPGLQVGYANCWPKYGTQPAFVNPTSKQGIMHAAQMISFDIPDSSCPKDNVYQAGGKPDGPRFDVHCGKLNPGRNITNLHAHNITACMDACAASDKGCKAILFSSVLDAGYNNCYLQNTTSIITDQATASYAVIADAAIPSSDDPKNSPSASGSPSSSNNNNNNNNSQSSSSSSSSSSPSKAWIAGPAIGGVIALSALGFAIFWFRRRRRASKNPAALEKDSPSAAGYGSVPGHSPGGTTSYEEADTAYYPHGTGGVNERVEMHVSSTSELPANVKYAGNYGPRSEAQEMPT